LHGFCVDYGRLHCYWHHLAQDVFQARLRKRDDCRSLRRLGENNEYTAFLGEIGIFFDSNSFWLESSSLFGALDNFTGGIMFFSSERGIPRFLFW